MKRAVIAFFLALLSLAGQDELLADEAVGWEHRNYLGLSWEAAAAPLGGMMLGEKDAVGGFSATASLRYVMWPKSGTSLQGLLRNSVLGEHFGVDLNSYGVRVGEDWLWMLGIDAALRNIVGESTARSRLQLSSLADVLLPEVGYAVRDTDSTWFLGWHARADYLVSQRLALSGRFGYQILYDDDPEGLVTASIGATLR